MIKNHSNPIIDLIHLINFVRFSESQAWWWSYSGKGTLFQIVVTWVRSINKEVPSLLTLRLYSSQKERERES